ncbi:MAG: DUF3995 domain-containing protein [Cytophagales bacterium]|nr:MAG: DUF3995 domain-containing protein [Cytophagales bacterium]
MPVDNRHNTMIFALLNTAILLLLSLLHAYWGFGGRWGWNEALPERDGVKVLKPHAFDCFVVAAGLAAFAGLHLHRIGLLQVSLPDWLTQYGLWAVGGLFLLRALGDFRYVGLFKRIRNSRFAYLDTRFYVPLCLLLALNAFMS